MKRVVVIIALLTVWVGAAGVHAQTSSVHDKVKKICTPVWREDNFTPDTRVEDLAKLGEEGRSALISLATLRDEIGRNALEFLRDLKDARAVPIARAVLNDPKASSDDLQCALLVIDYFEDAESLEKVLELFHSGDGEVQQCAAAALGSIGDARGLAALRAAYGSPEYRGMSVVLIQSMGVRGHDEAVDLLVGIGRRAVPGVLSILPDVIESLADIGNPRSRSAAMQLLTRMPMDDPRSWLIKKVYDSFQGQRYYSQDPAEKAEIAAYMDVLMNDPLAPEGLLGYVLLMSGDGQRATAGSVLKPFLVKVGDRVNVPMPGETVTWRVASGSGTVSATETMTDDKGLSSVTFTLGSVPGVAKVEAKPRRGIRPFVFTATALEAAARPESSSPVESAREPPQRSGGQEQQELP